MTSRYSRTDRLRIRCNTHDAKCVHFDPIRESKRKTKPTDPKGTNKSELDIPRAQPSETGKAAVSLYNRTVWEPACAHCKTVPDGYVHNSPRSACGYTYTDIPHHSQDGEFREYCAWADSECEIFATDWRMRDYVPDGHSHWLMSGEWESWRNGLYDATGEDTYSLISTDPEDLSDIFSEPDSEVVEDEVVENEAVEDS